MNTQLDQLLLKIERGLKTIVSKDITNHISQLNQSEIDFYGYAIVMPTWWDIHEPIAIYNCESDLDEHKRENIYSRYCVDEWINIDHQAFSLTKQFMDPIWLVLEYEFEELDDNVVNSYLRKIYQIYCDALMESKNQKTRVDNRFWIVWPENEELMVEFAKQLNSGQIARIIASEFGC